MLYFFCFLYENVGCGSLFSSVHPNIYYRTQKNNPRKHYAFLGLFFIHTFVFYNSLHYNEAITRKGDGFVESKTICNLERL